PTPGARRGNWAPVRPRPEQSRVRKSAPSAPTYLPHLRGLKGSVPFEDALAPGVKVGDEEDGDEGEHFDEHRPGLFVAGGDGVGEKRCPRVEEDDFDVEDEEDHG